MKIEIPSAVETIGELLALRGQESARRPAYTFLADGERVGAAVSFGEIATRGQAIAAHLLRQGLGGERALLLFPPGLAFVETFLACLASGVVAVPAYPPSSERTLPRLLSILADARPAAVLTTAELLPRLSALAAQVPALSAIRALATDVALPPAGDWRAPNLDGESLAFLQYTSGSTADPKGVMVSHANLLANETMIRVAFEQSAESIVVGWLPLYHDMGLIGTVLQPLFVGAHCILMDPTAFLQRPLRWLAAISRYRATTSGGPNFAYDLCVRRITAAERETLDLSSWRVAFNGAEPVRAETQERFAETFAPQGFRRSAFLPCYGLAEATLLAAGVPVPTAPRIETFSREGLAANEARRVAATDADARALVSCGSAAEGTTIVVADPDTGRRLPEGTVGEIWITGPHVARGYWQREAESAATFGARLAGDDALAYLRTGDLGFFDGGELFVAGRAKDLIILRGRNLHPQDLERTAEASHPALRPGCSAAYAVDDGGEERLVIAVEVRAGWQGESEEVGRAVREAVAREHEAQVQEIVLLAAGTIPKTSSGKIQRQLCRKLHLRAKLEVVGRSALAGAEASRPAASAPAGPARHDPLRADPLLGGLALAAAEALARPAGDLPLDQPLGALGLDSLGAMEFSHRIETVLGLHVSFAQLLSGVSLIGLAETLRAQLARGRAGAAGIPKRGARAEHALSTGQQAILLTEGLDDRHAVFNLAGAGLLRGELDVERLGHTFETLLERHPVLRSSISAREHGHVQRVHSAVAADFTVVDASAWSESELAGAVAAELERPFDLSRPPLLRATIYRRTPREHVLVLAVHHIVSDFWSLEILIEEMTAIYAGRPLPPADTLHYADWVDWQAGQVAAEAGERDARYWLARLAEPPPPLELPLDRPRPPQRGHRGASHRFTLDHEATRALQALAQTADATLYTLLLASFQALLGRVCGTRDLCIGTPTAGRSHAALSSLVGYFVNPVPLRADLGGDPTFVELAARARAVTLEAFEHAGLPFPELVERLHPDRDASRSPLFDVMFVFQRERHAAESELGGFALGFPGYRLSMGEIEIESLASEHTGAQFDLSLFTAVCDGRLLASFDYNADLFDRTTLQRLAGGWTRLLHEAVAAPERRLSEISLLGASERWQLLGEWNDTDAPVPEQGLHDAFFRRAAETPDAIALVAAERSWSYADLATRSRCLAARLVALGVGPEVTVGVCLPRRGELIVSLLAVLAAGGAYVPLDPTYPRERLAGMLADSRARLLLAPGEAAGLFEQLPEDLVWIDPGPWVAGEEHGPVLELDDAADPLALAYLIFTSGSTGRPKAVAIPHRAAVALVEWSRRVWSETTLRAVAATTSVCFDLSVFEIFVPLSRGGRVILLDNALALGREGSGDGASLLNTVPSALAELVRSRALPPGLACINLAGEPLRKRLIEDLFALREVDAVFNLYGPSEDTTYSTWARLPLPPERHGEPTIGRPITGTRGYVVDHAFQPVPIGVPGQLYLAGDGLARGYLHRPAETAARFVPDPFAGTPGGRCYATGDRARVRRDGELEFLGRADHQIKLRGFRIELGEIEATLLEGKELAEAAVLVRDNAAGSPVLVAYVAPAAPGDGNGDGADTDPRELEAALRARLRRTLPDYMLPASIVVLERLPRTPNGKLRRDALPAPAALDSADSLAPGTEVELALAEIWREVLGLESVGIEDDFFALGGHSLAANRILLRIEETFGVAVKVRRFFANPTILGLEHALAETLLASHGLSTGANSTGGHASGAPAGEGDR